MSAVTAIPRPDVMTGVEIPLGEMAIQSITFLAEEDWHMPIESSQYFIILFRVNQVFTFYHFIITFGSHFFLL